MSGSESDRRYSTVEVDRILKEAVLFDSAHQLSTAAEGLTLAQIAESAGEVGIPADAVQAAARIVGSEQPDATTRTSGFRRSFLLSGSLEDGALGHLARSMQDLPDHGAVTFLPGAVRWRSQTREGASTTIDIRVDGKTTSVVLSATRPRDLVALLCVGGSLGLIAGLVAASLVSAARGPELISAVTIGVTAGTTAAAGVWQYLRRQWQERMMLLSTRTVRTVAVAVKTPAYKLQQSEPRP